MPGESEAGSDAPSSQAPEAAAASGPNPFPGPRPFAGEDRGWFFGRNQELSDLVALLFAHRAILLHSPSGTGKTSLVNAGLIPRARERGFEFLPVARVRGAGGRRLDDPEEDRNNNRFVQNLVENWRAGGVPVPLSATCLNDALGALPNVDEPGRVVVLDQIEELFVLHPDRWRDREGLFSQVQAALDHDRHLHFLFVLRDDYLAALEALTPRLRDRLSTRYHLKGLTSAQALDAIVKPIEVSGRRFAPGVAEDLVRALRQQPAELPGTLSYEGEEVEPVQLQIVCRAFVERLPGDVQEISAEDVARHADVHQALVGFYEQALISAVKSRAGVRERQVRLWFERQLITPAHTRGLVFQGDRATAGLANDVVDELERQRIVQSEPRGPALWYELTHDRLIDAVLASNRVWYARRARTVTRRALVAGVVVAVIAVAASLLAIHHGGGGSANSGSNQNSGQITALQRTAEFHVHGHAGQLLNAVMRPDTPFQGELQLFDPAGRPVGHPSAPGSSQPLLSQTLPADGNYRIEVRGRGQSTGTFGMSFVVESIGTETTLTGSDPIPGLLTAAHVDIYRFEGRAGSRARILATQVYGTLLLEGPSGQAFTPVDDVSGAILISAVLPQDGVYKLLVLSTTHDSGPYTVQVQTTQDSVVAPGLLTGQLSRANPADLRTLRSDKGGLLTVRYKGKTPDTISLLSADGQTLIDNVNGSGAFMWPIAPQVKYILLVYTDDYTYDGGAYSVPMTLESPVPLSARTVHGRISQPGQYDIYRYDGTKGASVNLLVLPAGRFDPQVSVLGPDGVKLLDSYSPGPSGEILQSARGLPESGPYLIFVNSADASTGQYQLTVTQSTIPAS